MRRFLRDLLVGVLVAVSVQLWSAPKPNLGPQVSFQAPGLKAVIVQTITGTAVTFESLAPPIK
jgi:hypothetical protein